MKITTNNKRRTSKEELDLIRAAPNDRHSIKLLAILYGQAKRGSEDEILLYSILLRRFVEESQGR